MRLMLTGAAIAAGIVCCARVPAAEEGDSPVALPAEYAARYVIAEETISPDEKLAIIVPKQDSEEFPEGKDYLVAVQPFAILGALETKWPYFVGQSHGGISAEWSKDSSVALVTLRSKWGPGEIFLIEMRDGKLARVTNVLAKAYDLLLPNYRNAKPNPEPYNDSFDFIFESEEDRPVCRLEGKKRVIVDARATNDPKGMADHPWRAHIAATWGIAQRQFSEQKITRPRRRRSATDPPCRRRVCARIPCLVTQTSAAGKQPGPSDQRPPSIGFLGLGLMGQPMALNLARSGLPLTVWNRSPEKCEPLRAAGATVASSAAEVFVRADIVFVMMVNEEATDAVLERRTLAFSHMVRARTVVCMSSNAPDYSRGLAADINGAGGRYVEAPVSGSRKPAEAGQLVALLAGEPEVVDEVAPLLAPMCRQAVRCGAVGNGLLMKLSINLVLNQLTAALAEAVHFADRHALDLHAFDTAFNAGSMASDFTRIKIPKLIARDFSPQAATADALNSQRTIAAAARAAGVATPLLDAGIQVYEETLALGHGRLDMVSVLAAIEARTAQAAPPPALT